MNKRFLKIALLSAMCVSMPFSYTSCKDYDEDITEINTNADALSAQFATLQKALETAQSTASAAQEAAQRALTAAANTTDAAEKASQEAAAAAELAKSAAATAKAEAIQEVIDQLKPLIEANASSNEEIAKSLAQLDGKIKAIESNLSNIDLSDLNKTIGDQATLISENATAIEGIKIQLAALEQLKKDLTDKLGGVDGIKDKINKIDEVAGQLSALQTSVTANSSSINDIKGELSKLSSKISEVSNSVNTLSAILSNRLTSVTLKPDLYIGGIPTIEFLSAKYNKQELKNGVWTSTNKSVIITNNATSADYRLNPGTLTKEDIKLNELAYVSRIASARSGEILDDIINVASADVTDNGTLTVKLGKSNTKSLNLDGDKIYTVSLKVPVADKHLFDSEGEAAVYSEFTRLAERYFQPQLAFINGAYNASAVDSHLNDSTELYGSLPGKMVAKNIVYNVTTDSKAGYDLYKLVEGCGLFSNPTSHKVLNRADLQAYGMDIKFHKATKAYTPNTPDKTDQQAFVKLEGENNSVLVPVSSSGQIGNQVIIGKQPIIAATLVDVVNNNVIEQKYFKVLFTAEEMEDFKVEWLDIATTGDACSGASYEFTWKAIAERVLEHMNNGKGMSKEDFTKIYGKVAPVITPANDDMGTLTPDIVAANLDASIPVMTWTVSEEQLGVLKVGNNTATFTKTITFTDPEGLHPNVIINLKWVVTTNVKAAALGNTDVLKWANNTMKVYPVPMRIPYDGTQKAKYMTNILEGRYKPYTTGIGCGYYDIDYQNGQTGYLGEKLIFQSGYSHWNISTANQDNLNEIYYTIENNERGKEIVSAGKTVKIDWSTNINGLAKNSYVFGTINLQIVKILSLNTVASQAITDNSRSQSINIANAISLTDAFGNLVAPTATTAEPYAADYYKYYGVMSADFRNEIKLADDAAGTQNVRSLEALNMTANVDNTTGELTFQNNGAPLQANAYLIVPVTVEHLWGSLTGHIAVPLNKSNAPLNAKRK